MGHPAESDAWNAEPRCTCGALVAAPHAECIALGGGWMADAR